MSAVDHARLERQVETARFQLASFVRPERRELSRCVFQECGEYCSTTGFALDIANDLVLVCEQLLDALHHSSQKEAAGKSNGKGKKPRNVQGNSHSSKGMA